MVPAAGLALIDLVFAGSLTRPVPCYEENASQNAKVSRNAKPWQPRIHTNPPAPLKLILLPPVRLTRSSLGAHNYRVY